MSTANNASSQSCPVTTGQSFETLINRKSLDKERKRGCEVLVGGKNG